MDKTYYCMIYCSLKVIVNLLSFQGVQFESANTAYDIGGS